MLSACSHRSVIVRQRRIFRRVHRRHLRWSDTRKVLSQNRRKSRFSGESCEQEF